MEENDIDGKRPYASFRKAVGVYYQLRRIGRVPQKIIAAGVIPIIIGAKVGVRAYRGMLQR